MRQKLSGIAFLIGVLWSSTLLAQPTKIPVVGFLNSASSTGMPEWPPRFVRD